MRPSEQEQLSARRKESLDRMEHTRFHTHRPHANHSERFVQGWFREQFFDSRSFDFGLAKLEMSHRFTQKRRFARFCLHHRQGELR